MEFEKTLFPYFESFCVDKFGADMGEEIFMSAKNKLSALMKEADYRDSKYIKWHMDKNLLPIISIYQAFKQFNDTAKNAYEYTDEMMDIFRLKKQKNNRLIGVLPFGYFAFSLFCKSVVSKQYPEQGWDIQWIKKDKNEIYFDMKSCIYAETTKKYNCFEICPLFCKNDDVVLAGYKPAIVFERSETIAKGHNKCDFHFRNGTYTG